MSSTLLGESTISHIDTMADIMADTTEDTTDMLVTTDMAATMDISDTIDSVDADTGAVMAMLFPLFIMVTVTIKETTTKYKDTVDKSRFGNDCKQTI